MKKSIVIFLFFMLLAVSEATAQKDNPVTVNQLVIVANHPGQ